MVLDRAPAVTVTLPDATTQHIVLNQAAADFVKYLDKPGLRHNAILDSLIGAFHTYLSQQGLVQHDIELALRSYLS